MWTYFFQSLVPKLFQFGFKTVTLATLLSIIFMILLKYQLMYFILNIFISFSECPQTDFFIFTKLHINSQ